MDKNTDTQTQGQTQEQQVPDMNAEMNGSKEGPKGRRKRASSPCLKIKERAGMVGDLLEYTTAFIESREKGFVVIGWLPFMLPAPFLGLSVASFLFGIISGSGIHFAAAVLFLMSAIGFGISRADAAGPEETARAAWYLLGMDDAGLMELRERYLPDAMRAA